MVSEKLAAILLSRTDFSPEDISRMDEAEGWRLVYELDRKLKSEKTRFPEICFTGFGKSDKERLTELATRAGFVVKEVVTQSLVLLVAGDNAGPSKLRKAEKQNCPITDERGFMESLHSN